MIFEKEIAYQRHRKSHVLSYLCRIYVNMDHGPPCEILRLRYRPVGYARANYYQKICPSYGSVCVWLSVVSEHPEVERMLLREHAHTHHRMNERYVEFFAERLYDRLPVSEYDSSARAYKRLPFVLLFGLC